MNVLIICTGNTCRSPMAQALLEAKVLADDKQRSIQVVSAGMAAGGLPASQHAQEAMKRRGFDISAHCSQQVTHELVEKADVILTMTAAHKNMLLGAVKSAQGKTFTLAEYAGQASDVADPFGRDLRAYEACAEQLAQLIDKVWQRLVQIAGK